MLGSTRVVSVYAYPEPADLRKGYGVPGEAWCFQRVRFPRRQGGKPPHRQSSLVLIEVTI